MVEGGSVVESVSVVESGSVVKSGSHIPLPNTYTFQHLLWEVSLNDTIDLRRAKPDTARILWYSMSVPKPSGSLYCSITQHTKTPSARPRKMIWPVRGSFCMKSP